MLNGKHIVVTGGTGALGTAVVGRFLEGGAVVHIPAKSAEETGRFPHAARVDLAVGVDLEDERAVEAFYRRFEQGGGGGQRLWASIHIAGGFSMAPVERTTKADFLGQVELNLATCFLCCREAVRCMGVEGGRIVNVAARPGVSPELGAGMVAYAAAKAGVVALTKALGAEVVGRGVLVNAVAPSIMDTPANRRGMPGADHSKWPTTEEVGAAIAFLASPENGVTWGAVVPVYGRA
jgi:NAD(P)-dependent dehydrogenase (short-subunit alcohol dehydrogenase family)